MQPWDFKYTLPNVEEIDESEFEPLPKLQVSTCTIKYIMAQGSIEASQNLEKLPLNRPMPPSNSKLVSAKICAVEILTGPMSINETRLITLSINSKSRDEMQHLLGAVPEAGDSIGVYCRNDPMLSTLAIQLLALDPDCSVYITSDTVIPKDSLVERLSSIDQWVKISEIVTAHLDIMHFPKKGLCRSMAEYCGNPMDKKLLLFLASRKGSDHYMQLARLHASFIDFLYTFSSCMLPLDLLITLCPPLQPRSFSLSRVDCFDTLNIIYSPIKFVVGDENNESLCPIDRIGVCSSYLDRMCLLLQKSTKDLYLDIFLRLPPPPPLRFPRDPTAPIVLICTGTGVSPFMAFLRQEIIRRREFDKNFCNFSHISDEIKRNLETRNFDANSTSNFCSLEATRDDGRLDNPQIVLGVNNNNQILGSRCIWLIYGFRNWDQDFLMKDEILAMHSAGLITRLIPVQSRPTSSSHVDTPMYVKDGDGQPDELHKSQTAEFTLKIPKRYVQHALEENGDEVYNLISSHPQGAICVCGEELGMVREVNSAIARILKRKLELDSEREATLAVAQWTANRKIIRDVWV